MDAKRCKNKADSTNPPSPPAEERLYSDSDAAQTSSPGARSITSRSFSFSSGLFNLDLSWQRTELDSQTPASTTSPDNPAQSLDLNGDDQHQKLHKREKLQSLLALETITPVNRVKLGKAAYLAWPFMPESIKKA